MTYSFWGGGGRSIQGYPSPPCPLGMQGVPQTLQMGGRVTQEGEAAPQIPAIPGEGVAAG